MYIFLLQPGTRMYCVFLVEFIRHFDLHFFTFSILIFESYVFLFSKTGTQSVTKESVLCFSCSLYSFIYFIHYSHTKLKHKVSSTWLSYPFFINVHYIDYFLNLYLKKKIFLENVESLLFCGVNHLPVSQDYL